MAIKKYLSLDRLTEYDELIKAEITEGDAAVKSYVDTEVAKKANTSHTHDDRYYTESEIDTKISGVNTSISNHTGNTTVHITSSERTNWNAAKTHADSAHAPSNAEKNIIVGIQKNGTDITVDSSTRKVNITVPTVPSDIGAASSSHNHDSDYDKKGSADTALASAKTYADSAAATVKNDLLNGAGIAYDTLKELGDLIDDNKDAIDALETIASGKADASHTHDDRYYTETEIDTKLAGKANTSHGTHVTFDSTNKPKMDGTAAFGTSTNVARADHVHPTDTSRASQTDLDALETVVSGKADASHTHTIANVTNLQTTLDAKQATISGAASTITSSNLTASRALISNSSGKVAVSDVTSTELGYLDGVTSAIQTQLDGKAASGHTHSDATTSAAGFMTAAMVTKLNGIATGANKTTVDTALSSTSTNPVQNKVVNSAIVTATNAITANTNSITSHSTAISNLQTAVSEIQEITSEEIQALFA